MDLPGTGWVLSCLGGALAGLAELELRLVPITGGVVVMDVPLRLLSACSFPGVHSVRGPLLGICVRDH